MADPKADTSSRTCRPASIPASHQGRLRGRDAGSAAPRQSQLFTLSADERRTDVNLTLWKYAVIAGTVVDEVGEPVVGVGVKALVKDIVAGRVRRQGVLAGADRRHRRPRHVPASQVMPGTYVVIVPSTQTTLPVSVLDTAGQDATLRNQLFFGGIMEVAPLGQPRIQQAGDFALLTLNRVLIPPPATPAGRMEVYRTTYFPSAARAAAASPIMLESGEERTDLTIALHPVPAVRLSGRLVTPDGLPPPPTTLRLVDDATTDVLDSELLSGTGPPTAGFETVSGMSGRERALHAAWYRRARVLKHGDRFSARSHAGPARLLDFAADHGRNARSADPSSSFDPGFAWRDGSSFRARVARSRCRRCWAASPSRRRSASRGNSLRRQRAARC
jgi:hypothetical protein